MRIPHWLGGILKTLEADERMGGLEISDFSLRFAYFDGKRWYLLAERLPLGVVEGGAIRDRARLLEALRALHAKILSEVFRVHQKKRVVSVAVLVSSLTVYSQVFGLPILDQKKLESAVELNLQAASPSDVHESYTGWQVVGRDPAVLRVEVLSAFTNRSRVDELTAVFVEAGYLPVTLEFKGLAVARLFRERGAGVEAGKPYLVLVIDSNGLDLLVLRHGELYFEYFIPWHDVQGDGREIPFTTFETALVRTIHRVLNFYTQHWPERVSDIFVLSTGGLYEETASIITKNFPLAPRSFLLTGEGSEITSSWFLVVGTALRTLTKRGVDEGVNLVGPTARAEFREHRIVNFLRLWRILLPASLGFLLLLFVASDVLVSRVGDNLPPTPSDALLPQIADLRVKVERFNSAVELATALRSNLSPKTTPLASIKSLADAAGITIKRFRFDAPASPALLEGEAASVERITAFKDSLASLRGISDITLPIASIVKTSQGFSFLISFRINFESAR